jgi:catechol 2,3-dioxygenase-like lactoylglutathione lyase family enzyme
VPATQTDFTNQTGPTDDPRPRFGIGHLGLTANDVERLTAFYTAIGMRLVVDVGRFAILELRGGTHVIVQPGEPGASSLDLIVDDIDETHAILDAAGAEPGRITRGSPHDRFTAIDPEGNTLVVNSNHAIGPV